MVLEVGVELHMDMVVCACVCACACACACARARARVCVQSGSAVFSAVHMARCDRLTIRLYALPITVTIMRVRVCCHFTLVFERAIELETVFMSAI